MQYGPIEMLSKDDERYLLRSLSTEDAQETITLLAEAYAQSPYLTSYPDEWRVTVAEEEHYITTYTNNPRELLLGAFSADTLIALANLSARGSGDKLAHRGACSILVASEHQDTGVGRALMHQLLRAARSFGYEQLELELVKENSAAYALYRSLGFERYGELERGFRNRDGSYETLVLMVLPFYSSTSLHSASLKPTSTRSSVINSGRLTSIPSVLNSASIASVSMVGTWSFSPICR